MIKRIFNKKGNTNQASQTCATNSEQSNLNVDELNSSCNSVSGFKQEESKRMYKFCSNI